MNGSKVGGGASFILGDNHGGRLDELEAGLELVGLDVGEAMEKVHRWVVEAPSRTTSFSAAILLSLSVLKMLKSKRNSYKTWSGPNQTIDLARWFIGLDPTIPKIGLA